MGMKRRRKEKMRQQVIREKTMAEIDALGDGEEKQKNIKPLIC